MYITFLDLYFPNILSKNSKQNISVKILLKDSSILVCSILSLGQHLMLSWRDLDEVPTNISDKYTTIDLSNSS